MRRKDGFTVIELLLTIVVLSALAILLITQKNNLDAQQRDDKRKIAVNAMYYDLEKFYYPSHSSYPDHINSGVLTAMDPSLFNDPNGIKLGQSGSNYRYIPTNCENGQCKSYSLRATMEREGDYVKTSLNS